MNEKSSCISKEKLYRINKRRTYRIGGKLMAQSINTRVDVVVESNIVSGDLQTMEKIMVGDKVL